MSAFEDPEIYRNVLESLTTGVYMVDLERRIVFWNEGAEKITGFLRQEVVGHVCRENLLAEKENGQSMMTDAAKSLEEVLRDGKSVVAEASLRHKSGHRVPVRMQAVPIRNSHGSIVGAAESFAATITATEGDRRQQKLADYGYIDQSTGAPSSVYMESHLRESLLTFAELPIPFSILCIEVDGLDKLRSSFGPAALGTIQRVVADSLENSLRPTDFLGRWSQRQFLTILTDCSAQEILAVADRMRKIVSASKVKWWGDELELTASFGGTTARPGDTIESIVERAEKALADSVTAGGDCSTIFSQAETHAGRDGAED
jgi:PAS domain S-box-containing protein/diguanylate cyclase (GGDEF)-like protein